MFLNDVLILLLLLLLNFDTKQDCLTSDANKF